MGAWAPSRHLACFCVSMNLTPPRDDDPSGMTDFEKNTASEELEQLEQEPEEPESIRVTRERPNQELHEHPSLDRAR